MNKIVMWTYVYKPFILGGRCNQPTGCEIEVGEELYFGNDYYGYEVKTPSSKTLIVEKTSGAIIGSSLKDVRDDVTNGNKKVMEDQIKYACNEAKEVNIISQEEFWKIYK